MNSSLSRFNRAFEYLKKVVAKTPEEIKKQKLKFTSFATITELVCKSNDKSSLLKIAVIQLIQLLENADSNNRLIIDECLNKIIRASIDNSNDIAKVLIALLEVLSKNTNERCLKAALWRFAELSHFARPHKGKIYVQTLVPIFVKLARRKEDSIHETLVSSFPRIFLYIGLFTADSDVKTLLKAFLKNLSSDSLEARRAAAFIISIICKYSRKPQFFFSNSLSTLLDLLIDARNVDKVNVTLIQGCLSCVRQILSYLANPKPDCENEFDDRNLELLLQVYEICFTFASYRDHNVITAALETLHQLLHSPVPSFVEKLITPGSFNRSVIVDTKRENFGSSLSLTAESDIFSVGSTIAHTDDEIFGSELVSKMNVLRRGSESCQDVSKEEKQMWTKNWIQDKKTSDEDDLTSSSLLNMDTSHFANSDDEDNQCEIESTLSFRTLSDDNIHGNCEMNDTNSLSRSKSTFQSMKSFSVMSSNSVATSFTNLCLDVDIGDVFDDKDIPLQYCTRFLVTRFLLFGKGESVKRIRVSVVSLALNCLAQVFKLHTACAFMSVIKDEEIYENYSNVLEVVLSHTSHDDQQIRGLVRVVIGNIVAAALVEDKYLLAENDYHLLNQKLLKELVSYMLQGLEDESSVCIRHCLQGVHVFLERILLTPEFRLVLPLFDIIFTLVDNSYWLIKTKILEIFENISFDILYFVADNSSYYQEKIFHKVILSYLEDVDGRVRRAAAQCLLKFVPNAYYPIDHNYESVAATFAKRLSSRIKISYDEKSKGVRGPVQDNLHSIPFERSLARIVYKLSLRLASPSSSKNTVIGCCEALSILANEYPPIRYTASWQCCYFSEISNANQNSYVPSEIFDVVLLLMTDSSLLLNFDIHIHLLSLSSQLFIALCNSNLKMNANNYEISSERPWQYLTDEKLKDSAELFLRHLMRLSTIFSDAVTDVTVKSNVALNSTQAPMKPVPIDQPLFMWQPSPLTESSYPKQHESNAAKIHIDKNAPFGQYSREPNYLKLKVALRSAYYNHQATLKPESSEKFISFLETVLNSFGVILDFLTVAEVDRICKEFLKHLRNFMVFLPVSSVRCVVQLFRCVFGMNEIFDDFSCVGEPISNESVDRGFYDYCFQWSYNDLEKFFAAKQHEISKTRIDWELPRSPPRSPVMKPKRNFNINSFPSYIKLFEPNVIQSLKQYTVASDTNLQAEVLHLLFQLIQLKVNYCLLDSEQVFIKFLLGQFQLIEDEQLQVVDRLLPPMFNFLIHLANEKHSKMIMCVPKVIQLCDSLTASVQSVYHCILAIEPVVKYVFTKFTAIANSEEIKELETQQDVLFSILLRLIHNPKSLPLLSVILNHSADEPKLRRSTQITQILFSALIERRIPAGRESRAHIFELLFALHPASFDDQLLLSSLFNIFNNNKTKDPSTWLPFISLLLLAILSKYEESVILSGVKQQLNHPIFNEDSKIVDPLCATPTKLADITTEAAFSQFLCRMLTIAFQHVEKTRFHENVEEKMVILHELLLVFSYILKSGKFETVHRKLIQIYMHEQEYCWVFEITRLSYILLTIQPVVALQWYELFLYLRDRTGVLQWYFGQSSMRFSCGESSSSVRCVERQSISHDAIKLGIFFIASECKDEFIDGNEVRGFLENNFAILLNNLDDEPVQKLMCKIRDSKTASQVLVEIVQKMLDESSIEDEEVDKVLRLLDFVHDKMQGYVLSLCCRSNLLNSSSLFVRNRAFKLANGIVKSLSVIEDKEIFEEYFSKTQLQASIDELEQSKSRRDFILLSGLRDKALKWFDIRVPVANPNFVEDLECLRSIRIDKAWFIYEVKTKCCYENDQDFRTLSTFLRELPLQDLLHVMENQNFKVQVLQFSFEAHASQCLEKWKFCVGNSPPELSPLFIASWISLRRLIVHIRSSLPQVHEIYWPVKRAAQQKEVQYSQQIDSLFSNKQFFKSVQIIIPAVKEFAVSVRRLSARVPLELIIESDSFPELADFAVLCSQVAQWLVKNNRKWSKVDVFNSLLCCSSILKIKPVLNLISPAQIGSIISAVFSVSELYFNEVIKLPANPIMETVANEESYTVYHSAHVISTLVDYFLTKIPGTFSLSSVSLDSLLRKLTVVLSRSEIIYNYVRIPLEIWKHIPEAYVVKGNCLTLNTIPEHFLQDSDVLRNFVSRLMMIGWNNRLQFEECWMLLLIAFNSLPEEDSSEEEMEVLSQVNVVAVSAVSSILVQTMYHPCPGSKISPNLFHVSRYNNFHLGQCRKRQKLAALNHFLTSQVKEDDSDFVLIFNNVNVNLEKLHNNNKYTFNQISIEYLSLCCQKSLDEKAVSRDNSLNQFHQERLQIFQKLGIDTNSCVYFLMDFYSRWLKKPHTRSVHVLLEVVNSMLIISDLFTEITQFSWLLESCIILWQKHHKDNETVCSYVIVMMCKAAAAFVPMDPETKKLIVKVLRTGLASKSGFVQNATLHGLLYLLEKIFKKNILNDWENLNIEFESEVLSLCITYVLQNLNIDMLETFEKETAECLISVSFYLIENNACGDNDDLLIDRLLKLSVRACKLKLWDVHSTVMQGFYNLLLFDSKRPNEFNNNMTQLVEEILSTVSCPASVSVQCLQMLTTCMYLSNEFEDRTNEGANESFDTEKLVARIEKISFFFKRIKTGAKSEARFICTLLPQILIDLFPSSEILNKVILEFLSPSQRFPELMAEIVLKVFQHMIQQSEQSLIQDWVLSLLNNSRNYPVERAVFYLTCLFVSACANPWLVAFFPLITLRYTGVKYEDRKLLCLSAAQFYFQLNDESQKKNFIATFQKAKENNASSPLSDILKVIV